MSTLRALVVFLVAAAGCASSQITTEDLQWEAYCKARAPQKPGWCGGLERDLAEKRAAIQAAEQAAAYERQCYVVLEDPNATPQARGECRHYFAQQEAARAADADRRDRAAAVLQGIKTAADNFAAQNKTVTTNCNSSSYGITTETNCVSR